MVIGNNSMCGKEIKNNIILKKIAEENGFRFHKTKSKRDRIKIRALPKDRNITAESMDYEYVMVLQKEG